MRVKVVPPAPESLETLETVWRAVPLVPKPEESCCARLIDRTGVPAQDEAKEWLTFTRGLGLVARGESGYRRLRPGPAERDLQTAFREGVYGAADLLAVLEAQSPEPTTADEAFERFAERVPTWERSRDPDWRTVWRERVARLLEWAVLFELAERADGGYRRVD